MSLWEVRRWSLFVAPVMLVVALAAYFATSLVLASALAVIGLTALAMGMRTRRALAGFEFTAWIIAVVVAAMLFPHVALFQVTLPAALGSGELVANDAVVMMLMIQLVMFGMGTQMKLRDFGGVLKMPWGVLIGIVGQFTIMPLVGFGLTRLFDFEPEVAAGVILIGSCSSGLSSNVMAYLAKANLALSITMTSITTTLAPFVTPLWMRYLAGQLVEIDGTKMMLNIIKMVLVPVIAGLYHDLLHTTHRNARAVTTAWTCCCLMWVVIVSGWESGIIARDWMSEDARRWWQVSGFLAGAFVVGALYHEAVNRWSALERHMPSAAMFGILYVVAMTTASGRDNLLQVGLRLFCAAAAHNALGYVLGYGLARLARLDTSSARTVAFEVGMQNGGMASGLAANAGKLATMGLAAAIFASWMNVSGSILAHFWAKGKTPASHRVNTNDSAGP